MTTRILTVLMLFTAIVACGETPTPTPAPLTTQEYAEALCDLDNPYYAATYGEMAEIAQENGAAYSRLTPPDSLRQLHDSEIETNAGMLMFARERAPGDAVDRASVVRDPMLFDLANAAALALGELDDATMDVLMAAWAACER